MTAILAATLLLVAMPMTVVGIMLLIAGGSAYYAIAGLLFVAAGIGVAVERRWGYLLFLATTGATIVWAFWEAGPNILPLLPRLLIWLGIAVVSWLLWGPIDRRLRPASTGPVWRTPALAAAGAIALMLVSGILFHGNGQRDLIPDRVAVSDDPVIAKDALATPAEQDPGGDWLQYGGTSFGQRFSPLAQITPDNVAGLRRAWVFHTGATMQPDERAPREFTNEATPLKIGDTLLTCTAHAQVIAVHATTGKPLWRFQAGGNRSVVGFMNCRGVSYDATPGATGLCAQRVLYATITARMYALDLATGRRCPDFGRNGEIDLTAGMGPVKPGIYFVSSPPAIVRGKAVIGGYVKDNRERGEPSGVVRAFDTRTGALAWAFDMGHLDRATLPPPGESYSRGTPNVWTIISADPKLGLVYLPTGNETPDFFGGHRQPISEKLASAIVAVDADTGRIRWHYQTTHHDLWDQDIPSQATLVDLPEHPGAAPTPAVLVPTKRGELFIFDRRTGRPLTAIAERPVPQGAAAGDWTAPTQPYPDFPSLRPPTLTEASMWGVSPIDQALCRLRFRHLDYKGQFTPPSLRGALTFPGSVGVYEWGSVSVDPHRGVMYANTGWLPLVNILHTRAKPLSKPGAGGDFGGPSVGTPYAATARPFLSVLDIPCNQPPWGHLTAIDLVSRKILWRRPLGNGRDNGPFGIPTHIPVVIGTPNMGGAVTTAGGVIFVGATADRTFRAIDARTGKTLWSDVLPAGGQATPSVYRGADGRQYVVISAGGHAGMSSTYGDALVAYALPGDRRADGTAPALR